MSSHASTTGTTPRTSAGRRDLDVLVVGRGAPERGGIPTYLDWLTRRASQAGLSAELLNLAPDHGSSEGVNTSNITRTLGDLRRVREASRRARVVSIHSAGAPTQSLIRLGMLTAAVRSAGAKPLVHVHGGRLPLWATTSRRRRLLQAALRPAAHVVNVARGGHDICREVLDPRRCSWVPNGVDVDTYASVAPAVREDSATPVVLFVGGLTERKGVLDLLEASRILRDRGVMHRLRLVGGRPNEGDEAWDRVREALPEWVETTGALDPEALPAVYAEADVFCLPSWWEAMPLTVLEAMASGLPVVATRVGDVPLLVDEPRTGLVVDAQDPQALATALERLLRDPALRRSMGEAGRADARARFDSEATWERMADLIGRDRPQAPARPTR